MHDYDKSCKWMIQHYGDAILRMAGFRDIVSWKPLQAEPVHPRRLPDGLIEVQRPGQPRPSLFVLEISTYPYKRLAKQASDDALLVYLERGIVPDVVALVLAPRGKQPVPCHRVVVSDEGSTRIQVAWKVVELWKMPAAELLAADDVGLVPWAPLAQFTGPPEPIFRECRERIERDAPREERESLLVVTHFLAGLKYNDARLFQVLGGKNAMFKTGSPVLQEIIDEAMRKGTREGKRAGARDATESAIATVLAARFGAEAGALKAELKPISDDRLKKLVALASTCPDLAAFREQASRRSPKRRT